MCVRVCVCGQLYGGVTTIYLSLCGFNDTMKHGWHVHEFGTTGDMCLAAGAHFNPQNLQHGAPNDVYRYVSSVTPAAATTTLNTKQ